MTTGATLFSGFEGVGCGMKAAGITHAWGIEYDPDIAAVARRNGFDVTVADILECDPNDFEPVDVLHASPPCPNFSVAKAGGEETEQDVALGAAVCWFVATLKPRIFTLENVYGYRKAESFRLILQVLRAGGYKVRWWHLNSADYGVPQTRKRLILVASLDGVPQRPPATHMEPGKHDGQPSLFGDKLPPWVGWYEAIEDLIPSLPDSEFAPWQLERLPDELKESMQNGFIWGNSYKYDYAGTDTYLPAPTIVTQNAGGFPRAFIVGDEERQVGDVHRPAHTVRAGENGGAAPRAFVVGGTADSNGERVTSKGGDEPYLTVASSHWKHAQRAFVMDGTEMRGTPILGEHEPHHTVKAAVYKGVPRAAVAGRVVQMTPRALARFQSFPDWYELPDSKTLACRGIGNAVPPLLYQRVIDSALRHYTAATRTEARCG